MQVEHRKRFAGEEHLVVVQPDGTLALIPAWMSEETARSGVLARPCASRSRPRKLSEGIAATRFRQDGQSSKCLWTDSAEASSSLPRPYAVSVWSLGCETGWASIRRSPRNVSLTGSGEERPVPDRT